MARRDCGGGLRTGRVGYCTHRNFQSRGRRGLPPAERLHFPARPPIWFPCSYSYYVPPPYPNCLPVLVVLLLLFSRFFNPTSYFFPHVTPLSWGSNCTQIALVRSRHFKNATSLSFAALARGASCGLLSGLRSEPPNVPCAHIASHRFLTYLHFYGVLRISPHIRNFHSKHLRTRCHSHSLSEASQTPALRRGASYAL